MVIPEQLMQTVILLFLLGFLAFGLTWLLAPIYMYFAKRYKWWKQRRVTATTGEALSVVTAQSTRKRDVPTMAGLIVILAVTIITAAFSPDRQESWLLLLTLLGAGLVGIYDDIINVRGKGGGTAGLGATMKLAMIVAVSGIGAWFFYDKLGYSAIHVPFAGDWELGGWMIPLFMLVIVSAGNAVNITDGLDGLASGLLMSAFGAFGIIAALQGNMGVATFCATMFGALVAFVWFNIAPARFFMGDVGSFAFGTALGVVAMLTNTLFLLPLIGIVFVVQAGSSLIQILSKKYFHRKVFIAAPLHHHLQALEWEKTQVTMRYWIIGRVCAVLGVILALTGGYIV